MLKLWQRYIHCIQNMCDQTHIVLTLLPLLPLLHQTTKHKRINDQLHSVEHSNPRYIYKNYASLLQLSPGLLHPCISRNTSSYINIQSVLALHTKKKLWNMDLGGWGQLQDSTLYQCQHWIVLHKTWMHLPSALKTCIHILKAAAHKLQNP